MTEVEAIEKARLFLWEDQGVEVPPMEVHLISPPSERSYWWISFGTAVYYPDDAGAVIDGGEYILMVYDASGEVWSPPSAADL